MFIRVAILCLSFSVLATFQFPNCDCDVLQIDDSLGVIGVQNFTKQNDTYNDRPIYFSSKYNMISWNNYFWFYDTYDNNLKIFESAEKFTKKIFSFENKCKNWETVRWNGRKIKSRCLRDNSNCSATSDFTRKIEDKQITID